MIRIRRAAWAALAVVASAGCGAVDGSAAHEGTASAAAGDAPTPTSPTSGDVVAAGPRSVAVEAATGEPAAASASVSPPSPAVVVAAELSAAATAGGNSPAGGTNPAGGNNPADAPTAAPTPTATPAAAGCGATLADGSAVGLDLSTSALDCGAAQALVADYQRAIAVGQADGDSLAATLSGGWVCATPALGARTGGYVASCRLGERALLLVR